MFWVKVEADTASLLQGLPLDPAKPPGFSDIKGFGAAAKRSLLLSEKTCPMVPMVVVVEGDVPKGLVFPGVRRLLAESGQPVVVLEESPAQRGLEAGWSQLEVAGLELVPHSPFW